MIVTTQVHGTVGLVKLDGRFTFEDFANFKARTKLLLEGNKLSELDVNMSKVTYMDSNALSMLLVLKETTDVKGIKTKLVSPSPSVRTILEMVQFDQIFQIID